MLKTRAVRWVVAPSAALVGRMRYAQKFAIVGLVLFVPLALVAGAYVHLQRSQIEFSVRERHGVAYLGPLETLAAVVIDARHEAARGGAVPSPAALRDQLAAVDAVDAEHGPALGVRSSWVTSRVLVQTALSAAGSPEDRVALHNGALDSLLTLIVEVGDASNLTLDPDLDTYYLMDTVQFRLPVVLDAVARVSDVAALQAQPRAPERPEDSVAQIQLGIARGVLTSSQAALVHNLDTVVTKTRDGAVRDTVRADAGQLREALEAYSRTLDGAVRAGRADHVDAQVADRLDAVVRRTTTDSALALDALLEQRIDRLSGRAERVVAGTVIATLAAVYLFVGFYVSVVTSIRRIVGSLHAVAAGDLTQRVQVDTRDELRFVADVLNETVSRTREATNLLIEQATVDSLTGLANRAVVLRHLDAQRRAGGQGWVLFIDLDRFKQVNDSFGHESGDEVLREVAYRLKTLVVGHGEAGRLSGDEFVLITSEQDESDVRRLGALVVRRLGEQVRLSWGRSVAIGASVGICPIVPDADAEELLRRADVAMYQAKRTGRGRVELYGAALAELAEGRLRTQTELQDALDEGSSLIVHYQPIIDVGTNRQEGFEALARWDHPQRGLLLPGQFVDVAEDSGLILPLGTSVLATACRQMAAWQATHPEAAGIYVSVNVSPVQLTSPDFVATVAGVLAETGLAPQSLCLEITETTIMIDTELSRMTLEGLRRLGVRLAIDDFGVGHSSLAYLSRFPVHTLKLDRSFVSGMMHDPHDAAIVSMLIGLGANLDLTVVAEGVEHPSQREQLVRLGYSSMQGYLFGRPAPADAIRLGPAGSSPDWGTSPLGHDGSGVRTFRPIGQLTPVPWSGQ